MDWFFSAHVLWFVAATVFLLAELALPGFILLFFALGALAASFAAFLGMALNWQIIIFLAASLAGMALLRRVFLRVFRGRTHSVGDEDAGLPETDDLGAGKTALVTRAVAPGQPGEIKFRGSFWRAEAETAIGEGETVVITGLAKNDSGAYLVRPAKEE